MTKPKLTIKHQMQLTPASCVPACIAMITGVDQAVIMSHMRADGGSCGGLYYEFRQWARMGYLPSHHYYPELIQALGKVVLLTVPCCRRPRSRMTLVPWGDSGKSAVAVPSSNRV